MKVVLESIWPEYEDTSPPHEFARAFYSLIPASVCGCDCREYIDYERYDEREIMYLAVEVYVEVCDKHEALFISTTSKAPKGAS